MSKQMAKQFPMAGLCEQFPVAGSCEQVQVLTDQVITARGRILEPGTKIFTTTAPLIRGGRLYIHELLKKSMPPGYVPYKPGQTTKIYILPPTDKPVILPLSQDLHETSSHHPTSAATPAPVGWGSIGASSHHPTSAATPAPVGCGSIGASSHHPTSAATPAPVGWGSIGASSYHPTSAATPAPVGWGSIGASSHHSTSAATPAPVGWGSIGASSHHPTSAATPAPVGCGSIGASSHHPTSAATPAPVGCGSIGASSHHPTSAATPAPVGCGSIGAASQFTKNISQAEMLPSDKGTLGGCLDVTFERNAIDSIPPPTILNKKKRKRRRKKKPFIEKTSTNLNTQGKSEDICNKKTESKDLKGRNKSTKTVHTDFLTTKSSPEVIDVSDSNSDDLDVLLVSATVSSPQGNCSGTCRVDKNGVESKRGSCSTPHGVHVDESKINVKRCFPLSTLHNNASKETKAGTKSENCDKLSTSVPSLLQEISLDARSGVHTSELNVNGKRNFPFNTLDDCTSKKTKADMQSEDLNTMKAMAPSLPQEISPCTEAEVSPLFELLPKTSKKVLQSLFGGTTVEIWEVMLKNSFNLLTTVQELQVLFLGAEHTLCTDDMQNFTSEWKVSLYLRIK
nr:uncharacterized protein LOC123761585 [Procambarus clarkii]